MIRQTHSIADKNCWVFDLDGTLVDSFKYYVDFLNQKFLEKGLLLDRDEIIRSLGLPAHRFLEEKLGMADAKIALKELKERSVEDTKNIRAFEGIKDLLAVLKSSKKQIAVWTSREPQSAKALLHSCGLEPYISQLVAASCVSEHKPHIEGLTKIASYFGVSDPSRFVMVGDHDFDMMAARTFGAYGIRASWHSYDPKLICDYANVVETSPRDLRARL
jgi:phosphoglycolate phosphatase-like HAD superfamily hydrolase